MDPGPGRRWIGAAALIGAMIAETVDQAGFRSGGFSHQVVNLTVINWVFRIRICSELQMKNDIWCLLTLSVPSRVNWGTW